MRHAVSIVVFGSDIDLLRRTISSTLLQTRPPDALYVLLSGADPGDPLESAVSEACGTASRTVCRIVTRSDNLGFAGGHNYLARMAFGDGADWVTLLNPDLELDRTALELYWASVEKYEGAFAIHGPQLLTGTGSSRTVDSAGIRWSRDARHFDAAQGHPAQSLSDQVLEVEGVSGAVLTLSRLSHARLIAESGEFLDEMFLAYREDAELGRRVQLMGGRCLTHPSRGFIHDRGARNGERTSELQRSLGVQNRFLLKWRLGNQRPGSRVSSLVRDGVVVGGVLLMERSSLSGLRRAWAVRRFERYKGRAVKHR